MRARKRALLLLDAVNGSMVAILFFSLLLLDAVNGERRLCDVGGQHHLARALWCGLEDFGLRSAAKCLRARLCAR